MAKRVYGKRFKYDVFALNGKLLHKFHTHKVALAFATQEDAFVVNRLPNG